MLEINDQLRIPLREFDFQFARSSGPGGQNVNKVNSKATLRWLVGENTSLPEGVRERFVQRYRHRLTKEGELLISSQRFRDRGRNVADCLNKLRQLVADVADAPKKRKPTKPSAGSQRRRREDKTAVSRKKNLRRPPSLSDD